MTTAQTNALTPPKPLRLWPGVVAVVLQWLVRFGVPTIAPDAVGIGVLAGLLGGLVIVVWWLFFSRAPWIERVGALVVMGVALFAIPHIVHPSIATGMMGLMFFIYAIPLLSLALVAWAVASRRLATGPRRAAMVAALLLGCGLLALVRTDGVTGDADSQFQWRWSQTSEERLLARGGDELAPLPPAPAAAATPDKPLPAPGQAPAQAHAPAQASDAPTTPTSAPAAAATPEKPTTAQAGDDPTPPTVAPTGARTRADWPGFRGPDRDSVVRGARIETDWSKSPPVELWRRPIGPGWSSFAVQGDLLYTQEQRGDDEIVSCYNRKNGEPVWRHRDVARFWESNGGPGPRATPTLSNGRVYTFGATGIVNALDARDGTVVWSRNAAADTSTTIPDWGFASSPLVVGDTVIVAAAGALAAYDIATGNPRWFGPTGGWGYSSPHLATIDGVAQILLLNGTGAISVAPADGTLLWKHEWKGDGIVQPGVTADGDILIGTGSGLGGGSAVGMRRLGVAHAAGGWTVEERWTSNGLKPYFNDFVVHEGHAFGFDGSILACIDLADGTRKWKGGRYGHGQLALLPDQDLLLVLSEEGELVLVKATTDQFTEVARFPALDGKTWNHPVLVGDTLLARNGEEMVAFRLTLATVPESARAH